MAFISCVLCDKVFENQRKLSKHRNKVHSKKIKCKVCEKEFSGIYNAERHEKLVHEGSMASCPCCLQELRTDKIKKHMNSCKENKFSCDICKKQFKHETNLNETCKVNSF